MTKSYDGDQTLASIAEALVNAYRTKEPIEPIRSKVPNLTLKDAYAIQQAQVPSLVAQWGPVVGRKVGLTSLAMQRQLGVDSPDFGFFTAGQLFSDDELIPIDRFISPKVEPEFAFKLSHDLAGGGITVDQVAAAIDGVYPAIEIIDSRIANWDITLMDTVADNASCGAVAIGTEPLDIGALELKEVGCALVIDDAIVGQGLGSDVLGDPLEAVAWLANTLHEQGDMLRAGEWVLPGSFTAAAPVVRGSSVRADFGPLGKFAVNF